MMVSLRVWIFREWRLSPLYWPMIYRSLIDYLTAYILSHGYNNYLQKRERMHILNITEVNSLLPLLIEMEK
ncbi:hypothetical protein EPU42_01595 [Escherichia coli]|nr:hypothetical protein EPU42_01595 [Escherichia coli]